MILVGVDTLVVGRLAAQTLPQQLAVVTALHHKTQFLSLALQGLDTICLLDLQRGQSLEMEGDILRQTGHHERLSQVGRVHEVVLQLGHTTTVSLDGHRLGHTLFLCLEHGLHAQQTEDVSRYRVALFRAIGQSRQPDSGLRIVAQRQ